MAKDDVADREPPGTLPAVRDADAPRLSRRERDYMMLAIFVRAQHLRFAEADALIDALEALGERGPELQFARAVIAYRQENYDQCLEALRDLDVIDPPQYAVSGRRTERMRRRSFMRARSIYALTGDLDEEAQASLDFYLRTGKRRNAR